MNHLEMEETIIRNNAELQSQTNIDAQTPPIGPVSHIFSATFHVFWFLSNFLLKEHLDVFFVYATSNISVRNSLLLFTKM